MTAEKPAPTPTHIGPYHILDTLGEGGMGTVYLCEQREPVRRRVALKVIKLGMDSKAVLARFEAERQALSMMEHSCVARIYDAGVTDKGQPYFAMEYVKGIPITHYCDDNKLGLDQRIELFRKVCSGVQHAHLKGVMHRDLKPGNVLITVQDGKPIPKIIDFGLAKAMDHRLVEATLFTQQGQVIGTPEYMSPEQAGLGGLDVDTRTDVYSLGVLLYELLTGELPFSRQELQRAGLLEMQRILKETDATKPSTKITAIGDKAVESARLRGLDGNSLQKRLRGDLDWIVLKALEKDRTRRYETALELAADLERHSEHLPVLASPPSLGYRTKKFVRRYRVQCVAAAVVFVAIVGGGIGTWLGFAEARANEKAARDSEKLANKRAEENGRLAASEQEAKEESQRASILLAGKVREFDQLKGVVLYERVVKGEAALYPPWPSQIEAMERWLQQDAGRLLAMRPEIEGTVRDLEARALPATPEEMEADRRSHPRFAEFEGLSKRVASLRSAQAIREGKAQLAVPELSAEHRQMSLRALHDDAWKRVAPPVSRGMDPDRTIDGEEALGLALARAAKLRFDAGDRTNPACRLCETLAWALFANGQDDEALAVADQAIEAAEGEHKKDHRRDYADLATAIDESATSLANVERAQAQLSDAMHQHRTFRFELEAQRFLHDTLAELLAKLASLEAKEKADVAKRLTWARQIQGLTLAHPNARHTWAAVRAAIASNSRYAGQNLGLRDQDVTGLVPIGENPVTKLWEFYELRSAWDGQSDPRAIAIPGHDATGDIEVGDETGIVFVLLPGGTFTMGAQRKHKDNPNYDPQAERDETPHEVTLAPFFLARHELTRGQWQRLMATAPFWYKTGTNFGDEVVIGPSHPAESLDWDDANRSLQKHGLTLPTEAQWEYGCRGGQSTPWWTGGEAATLLRAANLLDQRALKMDPDIGALGTPVPFDDGFQTISPVGSFRANAFGLHDVHGNVVEWCRDWYGLYWAPVQAGDGLSLVGPASGNHVLRGGSFQSPAVSARSSFRYGYAPSIRHNLGCRPARALRP